jgi:hypothetical protein
MAVFRPKRQNRLLEIGLKPDVAASIVGEQLEIIHCKRVHRPLLDQFGNWHGYLHPTSKPTGWWRLCEPVEEDMPKIETICLIHR